MIPVGAAELARVLDATLHGHGDGRPITAVAIDSRQVGRGTLFVALPGEHVDGHDFVLAARAAGAVAALTDRPVDGGCCLVVPDVLRALGRLGRYATDAGRAQGSLQVVGITGSQGKTSTKDLLAQVLESAAPTVSPPASLNNEIGVPLTATRIEAGTRFLISEMGARGIGHIAYLCELTPPDVGVVLNVGSAHLGMFGTREAIAQAKGELVEALPVDGTAVLNLGDPLVAGMARRTRAEVLGFLEPGIEPVEGVGPGIRTLRAEQPQSDAAGHWSFLLTDGGPGSGPHPGSWNGRDRLAGDPTERQPVSLRVLGRHQIGNALAAAAAALALGLSLEQVATALSAAGPRSRWRMETHQRADGLLLVNDAYNANPGSMTAALTTLAELGRSRAEQRPRSRTVAVLGDMLELGETADREHVLLGRQVAELGIDELLAVGEFADTVVEAACDAGLAKENARMFRAVSELPDALPALTGPDDVVLLKASRAVGLETVADGLLAAGSSPGPGPSEAGTER